MNKEPILLLFGHNVQKYRKELGLSQERLAELAGVHRTYIGMVERAEKNITLCNIEKIAKAYDKYESDGDIAKVVTIKDIAKNDYSLSIPLYIQTSSEEKEDDRTVKE